MEASQNNGTRFREKEVTAFGSDVLVCYQRGVGWSKRVDFIVQPRAHSHHSYVEACCQEGKGKI